MPISVLELDGQFINYVRSDRERIIVLKMKGHLVLVAIAPAFCGYALGTQGISLPENQKTIDQNTYAQQYQKKAGHIKQYRYKIAEHIKNYCAGGNIISHLAEVKGLTEKFYDCLDKHFTDFKNWIQRTSFVIAN